MQQVNSPIWFGAFIYQVYKQLPPAVVLVKFGDARYQLMLAETNELKKRSYPKNILPFYEQAAEIGKGIIIFRGLAQRIKELQAP